jgi:hypothetical protein
MSMSLDLDVGYGDSYSKNSSFYSKTEKFEIDVKLLIDPTHWGNAKLDFIIKTLKDTLEENFAGDIDAIKVNGTKYIGSN